MNAQPSRLNPGLTLAPQRSEVRTVHPDTLHKAGFPSLAAAQSWIDKRGRVGRFAYYAATSPRAR